MNIIANSSVEVAWQLLQTLLFEYEEEHMTTLHRIVCEKMLKFGTFIPYWLSSSYKVIYFYLKIIILRCLFFFRKETQANC